MSYFKTKLLITFISLIGIEWLKAFSIDMDLSYQEKNWNLKK